MCLPEQIATIRHYLLDRGFPPTIDAAVILGSGLGGFGEQLHNTQEIPYHEIPEFPQSTVAGHSGALLFGEVEGKSVLAFSGRFHHYEGYPFLTTIIPVQLAHAFRVHKLIISNAAGGINFELKVGDLMVIENIIHPHIQIPIDPGTDWLTQLKHQAEQVKTLAAKAEIAVKSGTYVFVKGPNYETKAEIIAFRHLGGDAVGMSTVPELMEAARLGLKCVAISLITNAAAGVTDQKLDHAEVKEAAELKKAEFAKLVKRLVREL